ncbi:hypothetical protein E4T38_03600 [Aureobasidium subglaciale]|nr:hypothetical protein E4T38_03600 [Aureobasidium subglaciale]KAI5225705.1 hypothetical protein E4T40_03375 [Aureobasidium subglaciale]KAI5263939.1 hypothetical protein E4T46_03374 [Aureobasidium subglaciale]
MNLVSEFDLDLHYLPTRTPPHKPIKMVFIVSALYKKTENFKLDYYKDHHMPLAMERFKSFGLKSYKISELNSEVSQGYAVHTIMEWDSEEGMMKGFAEHGQEMRDDLDNFSDVEPVGLLGQMVKTESQ